MHTTEIPILTSCILLTNCLFVTKSGEAEHGEQSPPKLSNMYTAQYILNAELFLCKGMLKFAPGPPMESCLSRSCKCIIFIVDLELVHHEVKIGISVVCMG